MGDHLRNSPTESSGTSQEAPTPTPTPQILIEGNEQRKESLLAIIDEINASLLYLNNKHLLLNLAHLPYVCSGFTFVFRHIQAARNGALLFELGPLIDNLIWPTELPLDGEFLPRLDFHAKRLHLANIFAQVRTSLNDENVIYFDMLHLFDWKVMACAVNTLLLDIRTYTEQHLITIQNI